MAERCRGSVRALGDRVWRVPAYIGTCDRKPVYYRRSIHGTWRDSEEHLAKARAEIDASAVGGFPNRLRPAAHLRHALPPSRRKPTGRDGAAWMWTSP